MTSTSYWSRPRVVTHDRCYLTENLDQTILGPETTYRNKFLITTALLIRPSNGPYLFFQMLNDSSPEGYKFIEKYRSLLLLTIIIHCKCCLFSIVVEMYCNIIFRIWFLRRGGHIHIQKGRKRGKTGSFQKQDPTEVSLLLQWTW